jgi:hypothetical protein
MLTSGVLPYNYELPYPVRSDRIVPVGISGIMFEHAEWVMDAELRRHINPRDFPDLGFTWRRYNMDGTSRGFEPTTSGFWLANPLDPTVLVPVNYILELREAFTNLMLSGLIIKDCDYLLEEIRRDWLHNLFPSSPSGRRESLLSNGDGNYFRGEPAATGAIYSTDIGTLGASGVLYDIDIAEVMYQPYPRMGRSLFANAHARTITGSVESLFPIQASPVFPSFQDTQGRVVSTTERDRFNLTRGLNFSALFPTYNNLYDTSHVLSGVIRFDGDVLASGAVYMIGTGGTHGREDFQPIANGTFTYIASGLRQLGQDPEEWPFLNSGINSPYARVYLTPAGSVSSPVQSGVFRVGVKLDYDLAAVPSGIISCWPSGNAYMLAPGYQVFDDCFWCSDLGQSAFTGQETPSGLSVISPFNGAVLWLRHASLQKSTSIEPGFAPGNNWPWFVGLVKDGTSLFRARYLPSEDTPGTSFSVRIMEYDFNLNFIGEHIASEATDPNTSFTDLTIGPGQNFLGTSFFLPTAGTRLLEADQALSTYHIYVGPSQITRMSYFDGAFFAYGQSHYTGSSDVMNTLTMTPGVGLGSWSFTGSSYTLSTDVFAAEVGDVAEIWDVVEVTGATHINDGIWACFTADTGVFDNPIVCIGRIELDGTTYKVVELIKTNLKRTEGGPDVNGQGSWYDMAHMPIYTAP